MKYFLIASVFILTIILFPGAAFAKKDATGADPIFDLIGVAKPAAWGSWSESQKHSYLQSLGAYPPGSKHKYKGRVDLDRYFAILGIPQPNNWYAMTPAQRRAFIYDFKNPELEPEPEIVPEEESIPAEEDLPSEALPAEEFSNEGSQTLLTEEAPTAPEVTEEFTKATPLQTPWLVVLFSLIGAGVLVFAGRMFFVNR